MNNITEKTIQEIINEIKVVLVLITKIFLLLRNTFATLLTELFQNNVDKIKNSIVPIESDYQNLCVIFKLISNICINTYN